MDVSDQNTQNFWKKCSSCKSPIAFNVKYYVCSVSTCNGQRTGYVFCSLPCFERHLPGARHKSAGAVEQRSPQPSAQHSPSATEQRSPTATTQSSPARIIIKSGPAVAAPAKAPLPREILIIASRLKEYIQARADYNTSSDVMDVLSDYVRVLCDRAVDNARAEGRKTVLERDFSFLKNLK